MHHIFKEERLKPVELRSLFDKRRRNRYAHGTMNNNPNTGNPLKIVGIRRPLNPV